METIERTKTIPTWANYLAMDKDELIHCYEHENIAADSFEWGFPMGEGNIKYESIDLEPYCENWRLSLRKIIGLKK